MNYTRNERADVKAITLIPKEWRERITTPSNKPGYRPLSNRALNHGNSIATSRIDDIMRERHRRRTHIAAIHETHIPHGQSYVRNGRRIVTTVSIKTNIAKITTCMCQ